MKTMNFKFYGLVLGTIALATSCKKDDKAPDKVPVATQGVYVLNEGGVNQNNATLGYYDYASNRVSLRVFGAANAGETLGDVGNDVQIYGSKMYIVLNNSNLIQVVEAKTAKKIKTINMIIEGVKTLPRSIAFAKGKAFVSTYNDKVYVIDTASLAIVKAIPVGRDPEGLVVVGDKLYVANSGGLGYLTGEDFDKTVSVIDLNTLTEIKKIEVAPNLQNIVADKYGDVYVISAGNYADKQPDLLVIDSKTDAVKKNFDIPATSIAIHNDVAYIYKANYSYALNAYEKGYLTLNIQNETVISEKFIADDKDKEIIMPYALAVDPISGDVFIADAKDFQNPGMVYCFDQSGKKKYSFNAGVIPGGIAFYSK